jgi:DNA adenine methylase
LADPILKWAGGKRHLIQFILDKFPKNYKERRYHEPFLGAGAIFFKIEPKSGTINDINPRLINFFKVVKDNPKKLIEQASTYVYDEENYKKNRDRFNEPNLPKVEDAALLLYLNKTAFNGLYRVNSTGKFNVPIGKYKNPTIVPKDRIIKASSILKNIKISNKDFTYILDHAEKGDICYLDPPFSPVSKTSYFTSYSSDGFNWEDQKRLLKVCIQLNKNGVLFILSNSNKEKIEEMYKKASFTTQTITAKRAISSKSSTRGPIEELIVTNITKEI